MTCQPPFPTAHNGGALSSGLRMGAPASRNSNFAADASAPAVCG